VCSYFISLSLSLCVVLLVVPELHATGRLSSQALKFTVAKYYTPSGRCIQETEYKDGRAAKARRGGDKAAPFQPAAPPSAAPPSEVSPSEAGIEAGASEEGTSDGGQASNTAEEDQEDEEGDEEDEEEDEEEEVSFGRGSGDAGKKGYTARKVKSADRKVFKTKTGRVVSIPPPVSAAFVFGLELPFHFAKTKAISK